MAQPSEAGSPQEIADALFQGASALWGAERADVLRPGLERLAESLWTLSRNLPNREVEPAFFL